MSLTDLSNIQNILNRHGFRPNHKFGQNFLINEEILEMIVVAADLQKHDLVLEVGPGLGALTEVLAKNSREVFACELDSNMTKVLADTIGKHYNNVRLFKGDILSKEFYQIFTKWLEDYFRKNKSELDLKYKIVSNLPYQITSFFLRTFLTYKPRPRSMTLMIQKEVAERIMAKPGDMNLLALSVQGYARPSLVTYVGKENFYPAPEVDSAVIHLDLTGGFFREHPEIDEKKFFSLARAGFASKRKMLVNNLSAVLKTDKNGVADRLKECGIDSKARAEDLGFEDWAKIQDIRRKGKN